MTLGACQRHCIRRRVICVASARRTPPAVIPSTHRHRCNFSIFAATAACQLADGSAAIYPLSVYIRFIHSVYLCPWHRADRSKPLALRESAPCFKLLVARHMQRYAVFDSVLTLTPIIP